MLLLVFLELKNERYIVGAKPVQIKHKLFPNKQTKIGKRRPNLSLIIPAITLIQETEIPKRDNEEKHLA